MKKFITFLCMFILVFSVVGCGTKEITPTKQKVDANIKPNKNIANTMKDKDESSDINNNSEEPNDTQIPEQVASEAIFTIVGDWNLFFGETGPFTLVGEEIKYFDIDGNSIHIEDLNNGDTVEIMSSGMMMQSYPGQLAGVTEVKVIKNGSSEDLAPYQEIIDEFSQSGMVGDALEVDAIPSMNINYRTDLADVSMNVEHNFGYSWNVNNNAEVGDAVDIHDGINDLADANIPENTNLYLTFSNEPISVTVERYDKENKDVTPKEISTELTENKYEIQNAVTGLYLVHAEFQYGDVDYRFIVNVE